MRRTAAQWFGLVGGVLLVIGIGGIVAGILALDDLHDARTRVVKRLTPALAASLRLDNALINQETGVRGFALTGDRAFLEPYTQGRAAERSDRARLEDVGPRVSPRLADEIGRARSAAERWQAEFALPALEAVRTGRQLSVTVQRRGKVLFDAQRRASDVLKADIVADRGRTVATLDRSEDRVALVFGVFGVVLLLGLIGGGIVLRRQVVVPLRTLATRVRAVVGGDFEREVPDGGGASEVRDVAGDVNDMRLRILVERDELARSNAELEQFAYVASHDLQEPLRKIASFTQILQRRYGGQLDDRADTYIAFAVDGAERMQRLINDLLAFSRVGRQTAPREELDSRVLVNRAVALLQQQLDETGGTVEVVGELPVVHGEASLLTLVFQNLIGNGLKFRTEEPPRVTVGFAEGQFSVADNGIGIDAEYADRIFVIFQRLHTRETYEGTGIGLAMCRKVVEYHGGRIWLDTDVPTGTTFRFTLPT